jgi:hypothetical protein
MSQPQVRKLTTALKNKFPLYFDESNKLILPETLQWERLTDDQVFKHTSLLYGANPALYARDSAFLDLLKLTDPTLHQLLGLILSPAYRNLLDACKFPPQLLLTTSIKKRFHGFENSGKDMLHILREPGIVIGNNKYNTFFYVGGFDYDAYSDFLRKTYYIKGIPPKCFIATPSSDKSDNALFLPGVELLNMAPEVYDLTVEHLWKEFTSLKVQPPKSFYAALSKIGKDIENEIAHCFTFGQFFFVILFLKRFKFPIKGKTFQAKTPKLFQKNIFYAQLDCCSNCPASYDVTLDLVHQLVFIHKNGSHLPECDTYQRRLGYNIVRKIEYMPIDPCDVPSGYNMTVNETIYSTYKLGFEPIAKPHPADILSLKLGHDYKTDLKKFNMLVRGDKYFTLENSKTIKEFSLPEHMMTGSFHDGDFEGLIIGSKDSILDLSNQSMFQIDMFKLGYSDSVLAVIAFEDAKARVNKLGCIGFLSFPVVDNQLKIFMNTVKKMTRRVSTSPFVNLKHIVVRNDMHRTIMSQIFPDIDVITSMHWNAIELFKDILDPLGVELMVEAMFERNPIACMAKLDTLLVYYRIIRDYEAEKGKSSSQKAKEAIKRLKYVTKAKELIVLWASSFREILTRTRFPSNATEAQIDRELRSKAAKTMKRLNTLEIITVSENKLLKYFYDVALENYMRQRKSIDPGMAKLAREFEPKYQSYMNIDDVDQYGFGTYFSTEICRFYRKNIFFKMLTGMPCNLMEIYDSIIENYNYSRRRSLDCALVKSHKYSFIKLMTPIQEYKFNEGYRMIHTKQTKFEVANFKGFDLPFSDVLCGCNKVAGNYVPCQHMMYMLHEKCSKEIGQNMDKSSPKFEKMVEDLFEKKMNETEFYKQLVSKDMRLLNELYHARVAWVEVIYAGVKDIPDMFAQDFTVDEIHKYSAELDLLKARGLPMISYIPYNTEIPPSCKMDLMESSYNLVDMSIKLSDEFYTGG